MVTINFDLSNIDPDDQVPELRRILSKLSERMPEAPSGPSGATGAILDINGNTIGHWSWTWA